MKNKKSNIDIKKLALSVVVVILFVSSVAVNIDAKVDIVEFDTKYTLGDYVVEFYNAANDTILYFDTDEFGTHIMALDGTNRTMYVYGGFNVSMTDNSAAIVNFSEDGNQYLVIDTVDGSERIIIHKELIMNAFAGSAGFVKNDVTGLLSGGNSIDISSDTNLGGTAPIVIVGDGVTITQAGAVLDGYLSSADWINFNNAFGWGDHALVGYLTDWSDGDPFFNASDAFGFTWAMADGWNASKLWNRSGTTVFPFYDGDDVQINSTLYTKGNITMEGNRTINATKNLTIGNPGIIILGSDSNNLQIDELGIITLHGDTRVKNHIRVTAPSWKKGATAPIDAEIGIFPAYSFDKTSDDEVYYSLMIPYKIETNSEIAVSVDWCYTGGDDAGTVCWNLSYLLIEPGESITNGIINYINRTSTGDHTTGTLVRTVLTGNITGAVEHDILGLKLIRDTSEDTLDTDAHMLQVHFEFVDDKLGGSI